jgi:hypothetical protein
MPVGPEAVNCLGRLLDAVGPRRTVLLAAAGAACLVALAGSDLSLDECRGGEWNWRACLEQLTKAPVPGWSYYLCAAAAAAALGLRVTAQQKPISAEADPETKKRRIAELGLQFFAVDKDYGVSGFEEEEDAREFAQEEAAAVEERTGLSELLKGQVYTSMEEATEAAMFGAVYDVDRFREREREEEGGREKKR